jgi:hypothetical protein
LANDNLFGSMPPMSQIPPRFPIDATINHHRGRMSRAEVTMSLIDHALHLADSCQELNTEKRAASDDVQ